MSQPKPSVSATLVVSALVVCATAAGVATLVTRPAGQVSTAGPHRLDLRDATVNEARAAGVKLPGAATHVFYKGRKGPASTTTYGRFDLPPRAFLRFQDQLARRPGARLDDNQPVPGTWPKLGGDLAAPPWFDEHEALKSKVVVLEDHAASVSRPSGRYWALDAGAKRVYVWSWTVHGNK